MEKWKKLGLSYQPVRRILRVFLRIPNLLFLVIRALIYYIAWSASFLIPKKRGLWLFGAWGGHRFADNGKYLYLETLKQEHIEAVWITKSQQVFDYLESLNCPVVYAYSLRGILTALRSQVVFTTHHYPDIVPFKVGGTLYVELWHKVLAPKNTRRYDLLAKLSLREKILTFLSLPFIFSKPDYSIGSSKFLSRLVSSELGIKEENIILSGYPRCDVLLKNIETDKDIEIVDKMLSKAKYKDIIYYAPTFRISKEFDLFSFGFNAHDLIAVLEKTDSVLIFRFHPFDVARISKKRPIDHSRVIFDDLSALGDPYPLLKKASILVTDYSSTCSEFVLLDRPMIFADFDHEGYLSERELCSWYDEVNLGVKVQNWVDLLKEIENILISGQDNYSEQRRSLCNRLYDQKDGNSSLRLISAISNLVK